ncbi:unnamed protein product [Adineta steineri]|uniref:Uncharacterized protein n=1 Tax=Adineta steineri TaxID=433720 RepID=A0A820MQI1_9BILA|nr:unnamed protein product [Adineta steineri]
MPFLKWRKSKRSDAQSKSKVIDHETANGKDHHLQQANRTDQQADIIPSTEVILIYLTKVCHLQQVVAILNTLTENEAQVNLKISSNFSNSKFSLCEQNN